MNPLSFIGTYFIGSIVGGITVVKAVELVADIGDDVGKGIFRRGVHNRKHDGSNKTLHEDSGNVPAKNIRQNK